MRSISTTDHLEEYKKLSAVETRIMAVMWSSGVELTSREIHDQCKDMNWKLPALMRQLDRLEEKGFVAIDRTSRRNLYKAVISLEKYTAMQVKFMRDSMYDSNNVAFAMKALLGLELSQAESDLIIKHLRKEP